MKTEDILSEVYDGIGKFQQRLGTRTQQWRRNLRYYHGAYDVDNTGGRRVITNLVFGLVQRIIPSVYFKNPHVAVNPQGSTPRQMAKLLELVVNYVFGIIGVDTEMRKIIFDALFRGVGIGKVGMIETKRGKSVRAKEGPITMDSLMEALQLMQPKGDENPAPERGS